MTETAHVGRPSRDLVLRADPEELDMALEAIRGDTDALRDFREGVREPSGSVNATKTEQALRAFLEINEFSPEAIHFAVRLSPHALHPLNAVHRAALDEAARRKMGRGLSLDRTLGRRG